MVRNPLKQEDPAEQPEEQPTQKGPVEIREVEINLSLVNTKLNYLTGLVIKIADACKIDLSQ
jgi:hypothetical protein